jgi:threo-3-hydroxy-L-aspartate ammonia-lyase
VLAAAKRLEGVAKRTPVARSAQLDVLFGAELHLKCESVQHGGAFKFRGAYNAIAALSDVERRPGVVAYSSGNHAQAVALAAKLLGITAVIVMPKDAPTIKVAATKAHGALVISYDRYTEDREAICRAIAEQEGRAIIPPFNHTAVIAGQGTAALELFAEAGQLDALFMPLGGGGLASGCILVAKVSQPQCQVYGVEPEAGNDGQQSLRSGAIVRIATPKTIADGAQTQQLGELTFPIIKDGITDILTVTDAALLESMQMLKTHLSLKVEPTGVLGLAGLWQTRHALKGKRVGVVLSGGNVE